ncbi:hypothetical protein RHGRI_029360 [Rhododendron griersonianum]|uniref:GATA-type domain-containing protein n=1 Tax=Rhododendron griersonianum TaxID=479676 RepID=A0AAV6IJI8_9ERIC|nr:hypothetical protein RHGRI_029360 [Rhododendron griersonianum]
MMHRCNSNHAVGGACTCGVYHNQSNSFSMLFSMSNHKPFDYEYSDMYQFNSPPSYSSVDCTLSLGTPSTRRTSNSSTDHKREVPHHDHHRRSSFCWDILQNKHASSPPQSHRNSSAGGGGGDPLLARRCANCDTTSTPLWRNGPRGPKSLCNACGIRFKKEERRATASGPNGGGVAGAASGLMEPQQHMINNNSWVPQYSQSQKVPCFSPATAAGNEFRFIDGGGVDSDSGINPFLSWRLNVADRPGLVHDFTR